MCRATTCQACGKVTWAGCGAYVEQIMVGVPEEDRCTCTLEQRAAAQPRAFLSRLRRR